MVGLQQARRVVSLLRQLQTLLPQLARRLVRPPPVIELPESPQDGEELGRLAHALTERPRPGIGVFRLGGGKALRDHQRRAQGGLQEELLLDALGGLRERLEHREPRRQVADRLQVGGARHRPLACPLPVPDGLRRVPGLGEVVCEQFRLGRDHLRKLRFEHLRNPLVDLLPGALEQRRIGGILDQRMFEHIPGPSGRPRW